MYIIACFLSHAPAGLYRLVADHGLGSVRTLCRLKHVELLHVSGEQAHDKRRFLAASARALRLPRWFGMNWDALADCLTEFDWRPGSTHVLLLSGLDGFAKHSPPDFAMALAILEDAASFWTQRGVRFLVLLESRRLPRSLRLSTVRVR
jgi:hypothetical protein